MIKIFPLRPSKIMLNYSKKNYSLYLPNTIALSNGPTSLGSCNTSKSIFSTFLIIETFWWSLRGYSKLVGPALNNYNKNTKFPTKYTIKKYDNMSLTFLTLYQKFTVIVGPPRINDSTWCHQYIGIYKTSPGSTTVSYPFTFLNLGNLL